MKRIFLGLLAVAIMLVLSACNGQEGFDDVVGSVEVSPEPLASFVATLPRTQSPSIAHGANDFAFRLTTEMLSMHPEDNFIMSPFSVWLPLAAVANVTNEDLLPQLLEVLGAEGSNVEDINNAAAQMLFYLTSEHIRRWDADALNPLHIANAIFANQNMPFNQEFAEIFAQYFLGTTMNVDFTHPSAADAINQWASDNTDGLIDNIVSPDVFDEFTVAAIANAIYFSSPWVGQFSPELTQIDTFYGINGQSQVQFMCRSWSEYGDWAATRLYYEDDFVQSINLDFSDGGTMTILLPANGDANGLLAAMTNEYFNHIQQNKQPASGRLRLPIFDIENEHNALLEALENIGIPITDQAQHPLNEMLDPRSLLPIYLSDAVQVATIEVDEEGATAAAVTVMTFQLTCFPPRPQITFEMIVNRPFVLILHKHSIDGVRQVLFVGVVNQL